MPLRTPRRRRLAGAERGSRVSQVVLNSFCDRMRATEHAPRGPFRLLERRHSRSEIAERSAVVLVVSRAGHYRRIPHLRAPLQAPIESKDGKNGIQQPDGCPAGLLSLFASLRRKTTQARPETPPESSRDGWSRGSPGGRAQPECTRKPAHKIQLIHGLRPRDARACRRGARALPRRPRAAAFCLRPGRAMR